MSPDATQAAPGCPHRPACPGCPLIDLPYAEGLSVKAAGLERALGRHPDLARIERGGGVLGTPDHLGYRVRAKLVSDAAGRLGLFAAGSHEVVDVPGCRVQAPELMAVARSLRALLPLEIPLRGVDLRLCDRGVLLCLVVEGAPDPAALARVQRRVLEAVPHVCGLALNVASPGSVQLLGRELQILSGADAEPHHLTPGGPWHYASHGAFTQVHAGQAERLHHGIERRLEQRLGGLSGRRILELYAGSGALALRLAARGARVTAIEAFEPARQRIAAAAEAQGLAIETRSGDAEGFLSGLGSADVEAFDAVLVNPPRRGLAPLVRTALARLRPRLIAYVSCEPETLARDLVHLSLLGLGACALEALDMIPLSDAVESLAFVEPAPPPVPQVLFEDAASLAVFKLPFEPITSGDGWDPSLLDRARRGLGLPELTPVQRLDRGASGVCWLARSPEQRAPLTLALEQGERTYVALARGITHDKGKIGRPLSDAGKARPALTRYRRTAVIGGHSLLELRLEQERKHQPQRHLAAIGHAILGDARYGQLASNRHFEHRYGLDRPFLHCAALRVSLAHGPVEIRAPLAGDLAAVLDGLARPRQPHAG